MIREFLIEKYGKLVTESFLTDKNEVIHDNFNSNGIKEQQEVISFLKEAKDTSGVQLVPEDFWNEKADWGFDFSSWIGEFDNKELMFIGAEPHIGNNFQLVYDFGNFKGLSLTETALKHYKRNSDIWSYLTQIFVDELIDENITKFLKRCYITDLCHIVPKNCGQVKDICKKLSIKPIQWNKFRSSVAKRFLLQEIRVVNPKYIILHGNPSREFFEKELGLKFTDTHPIENSNYTIKEGKFDGYKIISIPHLKGDVRNKLWKCSLYPERPKSAKKILNELIKE
jgi:hypothetical protein